MKVLTIRQPWAWAIAAGYKYIENRTWTTSYRGKLGIHAGARWDDDAEDATRFIRDTARAAGHTLPHTLRDAMPLTATGYVLAVVDLVDICEITVIKPGWTCNCGPWAVPGQAHWRLDFPRKLDKPLQAKGRLGLWELDFTLEGQEFTADEIVESIEHALEQREIHAIDGLLKLLAVRDPRRAEELMETLKVGLFMAGYKDGMERTT
jgi:hypothetical protein